jgi:hypothetical protein
MMDWKHRFDRLDLDDQVSTDKQVDSIAQSNKTFL